MRTLGTERGGYVVAIFDCCREQFDEVSRGSGKDVDEVDMSMEDYHNYILWFGCPPGSQVDATSTIAVDFFAALR